MRADADRVELLFAAAVARADAAERAAYLDGACGEDRGLRQRVDALLASHEADEGFMREPLDLAEVASTVDLAAIRISEGPGTVIGRYKLLERIGEGGCGVVFMAEQQTPVRRKVALKVIKPGLDSRQFVARFEAERQALAMMDHPNIARVFDAGATDSGRPYFVMELVHGVPITEFCDKNQLPPRERLELFVQVCRAVQHAHTKGIIHRDIKPTNVLVTLHEGAAVPKVIDFGIAKATQSQLTEKTLFTNFAQMVGTPLYMSPEQAEMTGIDVDTRSDVYSLGVVLYELLTGTTPVDQDRLKKAAFDEVRRIIREEEPPRPSTRVSTMGEQAKGTISARRKSDAKRLGPLFRGELDWIVMKALEKDRARRYETANGLAADVQRYLADEPVSARPSSAAYRAEKFVRKHKVGVAAAAAVAAALVLGIAGAGAGLVRARSARRGWEQEAKRAQHQAERATALNDFMGRMLSSAKPGQDGRDVRVADLLDAAASDLDDRFHNQPDLEVAARESLRAAYDSLGMPEQAIDNLRRAHEASRRANGEDGRDSLRLAAELSHALAYANQAVEAQALARAAYERAVRVLGRSDHVTLSAGTALVDSLGEPIRYAEAERLDRALIRDTPTPPDEYAPHRLWALAWCLERRGERPEAIRLAYQALDVARANGTSDPLFRLRVIQTLCKALVAEGRLDEAERVYAAVVSDPVVVAGQFTVGASRELMTVERVFSDVVRGYAALLESRGKAGEATRMRSEHLAHLRAALPPPGADSASTLIRRANLLARLGKFEDAAADYARAIELNPGNHWPWYLRGYLLAYTGQSDAYRAHCRSMLRQFGTTKDRIVAERVARSCMIVPGATPDFAPQRRLVEVVLAPGYDEDLLSWNRLLEGIVEYRQGHFAPAIVSLDQSLQLLRYDGLDAFKSTATLLMAMAHHRLGHAEQALALLGEARAVMEQKLPKAGEEDLESSVIEDWLMCHAIRREAEALLAGG